MLRYQVSQKKCSLESFAPFLLMNIFWGNLYIMSMFLFRTKSTSHLKLHKKSVHEGIKHQCDLCDRSYNFPGKNYNLRERNFLGLWDLSSKLLNINCLCKIVPILGMEVTLGHFHICSHCML